jgi:hypothetical protein
VSGCPQPQLLMCLVEELVNEGKEIGGRQLAGLYLKNTIAAKDPAMRQYKRHRWLAIDPGVRSQVKHLVSACAGDAWASRLSDVKLSGWTRRCARIPRRHSMMSSSVASLLPSLAHGAGADVTSSHPLHQVLQALQSSEHRAATTAAQVVGVIGAVELPLQQWPELLPTLLQNVIHATNDGVRISTLQVRRSRTSCRSCMWCEVLMGDGGLGMLAGAGVHVRGPIAGHGSRAGDPAG